MLKILIALLLVISPFAYARHVQPMDAAKFPALVTQLKSTDLSDYRPAACAFADQELSSISLTPTAYESIFQSLIAHLAVADAPTRRCSLIALGQVHAAYRTQNAAPPPPTVDNQIQESALPALLQMLSTDDPEAYFLTGRTLSELGLIPKAFPTLVKGLKSQKLEIRVAAAGVLSDRRNGEKMTDRFQGDATSSDQVVSVLRELLQRQIEDQYFGSYSAVEGLGNLRGLAKAAVPDLAAGLKSPKAEYMFRQRMAWALGQIDPTSPAVLAALIGALDDKSPAVRRESADAIAEAGPAAAAATPRLKLFLKDKDVWMRRGAAAALKKIQPSH